MSGELEPRLAVDWASPDGLAWTMNLRRDVTFSDGAPFTSADVVFSFAVLYDERVQSPLAGSLMIDGRPITVSAPDPHTVVVTLPSPYAPGLSLLDSLPILPSHTLKPALDSGTFREAWSTSAAPSEIVGLGPFVLREYVPGERLVFARNPRFWITDAAGGRLPYLDDPQRRMKRALAL